MGANYLLQQREVGSKRIIPIKLRIQFMANLLRTGLIQCGVVEPRCVDSTIIRYVGEEAKRVYFKDWARCSFEATLTWEESVTIKTELGMIITHLVHQVCPNHAPKLSVP